MSGTPGETHPIETPLDAGTVSTAASLPMESSGT